jgi:hypothetical protein
MKGYLADIEKLTEENTTFRHVPFCTCANVGCVAKRASAPGFRGSRPGALPGPVTMTR